MPYCVLSTKIDENNQILLNVQKKSFKNNYAKIIMLNNYAKIVLKKNLIIL